MSFDAAASASSRRIFRRTSPSSASFRSASQWTSSYCF
eukprot:CAMPEP_0195140988 /NCGR_PEP_ID=MMETSP0448-20130528/162139_1 /TAXON_ID=66468 /ORGANISM="Heterocapsa triquestra, Strain CCMP 448" /LENGTH=37 /DNA_ID= /DNA_START= /DNA_END= /DNA_ORIENTATION=